MLIRVIASALLCFAFTPAALADYSASRTWFRSLDQDDRLVLQFSLMFTDNYVALADGLFGRRTYEALINFQTRHGLPKDGVLSPSERDTLISEAAALWTLTGFRFVDDAAAGLTLGVPTALLHPAGSTSRGSRWESSNGTVELETVSIPVNETAYTDLYDRLTTEKTTRHVSYSTIKPSFFIVSGMTHGKIFYTRFQRGRFETRGFSLAWTPDVDAVFSPLAIAISNSLSVGGARVTSSSPQETPARPVTSPSITPNAPEPHEGFGSGFFVDENHIVTAGHVVEDCGAIEIVGYGKASLLRTDATNDLAVLESLGRSGTPAKLRRGPVRLGEEIVALGYPLTIAMADTLTVTGGNVNALSGLGGDSRILRISAPIQPGNSGGPLVDRNGNIVGLVTSKLDELRTLEIAGTLPQNVNFALKASLIDNFLASAGIEPEYASGTSEPASIADVAEIAKPFTVQLHCRPE
ncbi:serine protease [Afifella sp. H1R]|uniref:serine protease n=1 Tax=Afifella sp. H1R TaxID=2908841 RepID=UPI001F2E94D6|nr:serine protease [Afifella sp. H1R]MCF1503996.1 serine protease [Afifella sp. H1R]